MLRWRRKTATASRSIAVGQGPEGVTSDGTTVFVANQFSNTVTKLRASDGALAAPSPWALPGRAGLRWRARLGGELPQQQRDEA